MNYSLAMASVPGAKRFLDYEPTYGTANQDAYLVAPFDDNLLILVGDGCSQSVHSAAGLRFSLRNFAHILTSTFNQDQDTKCVGKTSWWKKLESEFLNWMIIEASSMLLPGQEIGRVIHDYFLFSFIGALITPKRTWVFGCGDCQYSVNGTWWQTDQAEDNHPSYFAYNLMDNYCGWTKEEVALKVYAAPETNTLRTLILGSDGLLPWINSSSLCFPGTNRVIPSINRTLSNPRIYSESHLLKQILFSLVAPVMRLEGSPPELFKHEGVLDDDSTMVVFRQKLVE